MERIYIQIFVEVILPQQTLYYYIENPDKPKLGITYLRIFEYLIPKQIYPQKKGSLAQKAVKDMGLGEIGYAYTPMTEAYLNFQHYSGFLLGILLFIIIYFSQYLLLKGHIIIYSIIYIEILNFNRGEFGTTILEIIIQYFIIILFIVLAKGEVLNGKLYFFNNANNKQN